MKKFIFYAVALLSVASLLNGCKKDDGNESKGPNVEKYDSGILFKRW